MVIKHWRQPEATATDGVADRVLLGICAANRDLLLEWARAGMLPNYRSAIERSLTGFVDSMPGFYVGTTWPSFATCVSPAQHGRHYIAQIEPGTYEFHREPKGHGIRRPPFWEALILESTGA